MLPKKVARWFAAVVGDADIVDLGARVDFGGELADGVQAVGVVAVA